MRKIILRGLADALGGPALVGAAELRLQYWAGTAPVTRVDGADVTFPDLIRVRLVDGVPDTDVLLPPTGGVACVRVEVRYRGFHPTRYVSIPDGDGDIDFGDLPVVDPSTFAPLDPVPPSAQEILTEAGQARDEAQAAAREAEAIVKPPQVLVADIAPLSVGVASTSVAVLPSRALLVPDSVHEWWSWPIARRIGRVTYGAGYGSNGEVIAWDRHDRDGLRSFVVGDAGTTGPGGEVDDHDAPARWVSDDGGFSVIFWQNHGDTDYFCVRPSLDGTAAGMLRSPETQVALPAGSVVSYTQAFLHSVAGDEYTFWILTRSSAGWPVKVVTVNRATGAVVAGALYRTVTIGGDQPYVIAVQQGRNLRLAAYVNPAYDVHAIWLLTLNLDTGLLTNVMGGATHDITSGVYLDIAPLAPFVPETSTTATSRRLYYPHPTENRVLYSEWARGSEPLASYREASRNGPTLNVRVLGPAAGPRNGYTVTANYNPGAAYSPDGTRIATLHNNISDTGGEVHIHSASRTWLTQKTSYRLSRPTFISNDELMMLAVDHYTDYFNFLMHQVSIVGFPEIEGQSVVTHPLAASAGSLWLLDPSYADGWGSGIPTVVPNLADGALAGVSVSSSGGIAERTLKGGLHSAPPKSATSNMSITVTEQAARDAIVAALAAGHELFMGEVYRITRAPTAGYAPTSATTRYLGIINTGSGDYADIRTDTAQAVLGRASGTVLNSRAGTSLPEDGVQAVLASMTTAGTTPGASTAMTVLHNGGAGSPMASRVMYLAIIEDLTVSGRTYAQVAGLVDDWILTEFGAGGRYADDSWTTPTA